MTSEPRSVLMWAYYADGHRGVAVRFNMDPKYLQPLPFLPVEVFYAKDFPKFNYYEAQDEERILTIIGTKSVAWQHEAEWRMVTHRVGYSGIPPGMLNGVIFGLQTPRETEDRIREWVKARRPPIELLRIKNKPDSFELEVVEA